MLNSNFTYDYRPDEAVRIREIRMLLVVVHGVTRFHDRFIARKQFLMDPSSNKGGKSWGKYRWTTYSVLSEMVNHFGSGLRSLGLDHVRTLFPTNTNA